MKTNKITILIVLGIIVSFYWFQLRPSEIRKECFKKHLSDRQIGDEAYINCLRSKGIND